MIGENDTGRQLAPAGVIPDASELQTIALYNRIGVGYGSALVEEKITSHCIPARPIHQIGPELRRVRKPDTKESVLVGLTGHRISELLKNFGAIRLEC